MGFFLQPSSQPSNISLTVYNESMKEELDLPVRAIVATNEAPKAIGPYSQAVRAGNLLFISGQIALHPETQQVIEGVFRSRRSRFSPI